MQGSLQRIVDSILAVDIGSVRTRVVLVDRVAGAYRFVAVSTAPTTAGSPHRNVGRGIRAAIQELESAAGRRLLGSEGQLIVPEGPDGGGVDLCIATTSAAPPLRVAVGGLVGGVSVASAQRAARGTYSTLLHTFALDDTAGRWGQPRGALGVVEQLLGDWPEAIVLAGGTEGGAEGSLLELAEAVGLALRAAAEQPLPTVIFAGNSELRDALSARVGANVPLMVSENVRPTLHDERLQQTVRFLDQQFRARSIPRLPGIGLLRAWGSPDPVPTVETLARVVQYLSLRPDERGEAGARRVLGVDVGGGSAALAVIFENRVTQSLVRTDLAIGRGAEGVLEQVGAERLATWVPGLVSAEELAAEFLNLGLHPGQQPATPSALRLLQGAAREVLRLLVAEARAGWPPGRTPDLMPPFDIILGTGAAIREAPRPEQALAILLDGLQPTGITHLFRDRLGLSATIGALADVAPYAAADLMEAQGFESLGVVITPVGRAQPGETVMRFRLTQDGGTTEGVVEAGQSFRFPTSGETRLELRPTRAFDIGLGAGMGTTLTRSGDTVGFVIDARGRPLQLPTELEARRARAEEWMRYVGA